MSFFTYDDLEKEMNDIMTNDIIPLSEYKEQVSGYGMYGVCLASGHLISQTKCIYGLFKTRLGYDIDVNHGYVNTYNTTKGRYANVSFQSEDETNRHCFLEDKVGVVDTFRFLIYSAAVLCRKDLAIAVIISAICNELLSRYDEYRSSLRRYARQNIYGINEEYLKTLHELNNVAKTKMAQANMSWNPKCKYYIPIQNITKYQEAFEQGATALATSFTSAITDYANSHKAEECILCVTIMNDSLHDFFCNYAGFYNSEFARLKRFKSYENSNLLQRFEYRTEIKKEYAAEYEKMQQKYCKDFDDYLASDEHANYENSKKACRIARLKYLSEHNQFPETQIAPEMPEQERLLDEYNDKMTCFFNEHSEQITYYTALEELYTYNETNSEEYLNKIANWINPHYRPHNLSKQEVRIDEDILNPLTEYYCKTELYKICIKSKAIAKDLLEEYKYPFKTE